MTKRLSDKFFGDKRFNEHIYHQFQAKRELSSESIKIIFAPYTQELQNIESQDHSLTLYNIFHEFINNVLNSFAHWPFQKLSSAVEISAHVFEHSFQKWLNKKESYAYFSEVVTRHSLFRPPHSIFVFTYEEMIELSQFWIRNFVTYYDEYRQCMASEQEQMLISTTLPIYVSDQVDFSQGKIVQKTVIDGLLHKS